MKSVRSSVVFHRPCGPIHPDNYKPRTYCLDADLIVACHATNAAVTPSQVGSSSPIGDNDVFQCENAAVESRPTDLQNKFMHL
jgi:hypothetical protein